MEAPVKIVAERRSGPGLGADTDRDGAKDRGGRRNGLRQFFEECYCESGALSQHAMVSKQILTARYASLFPPAEQSPALTPVNSGPGKPVLDEIIADKGYHSNQTMVDLDAVGLRSYIAEPDRGSTRLVTGARGPGAGVWESSPDSWTTRTASDASARRIDRTLVRAPL
jgi:hypothetical protein